jgi:hypothetical protein
VPSDVCRFSSWSENEGEAGGGRVETTALSYGVPRLGLTYDSRRRGKISAGRWSEAAVARLEDW